MRSKQDSSTSPRAKILDAASELFYFEGIRATSADKIISLVSTTKSTFYRYFPTKDDLVVAYLQKQAGGEVSMMGELRAMQPATALSALVSDIVNAKSAAGFRGCPFINAAAEYPDDTHAVRLVISAHRQEWLSYFRYLAGAAGAAAATSEAISARLMLARDGALVSAYLDTHSSLEDVFLDAFTNALTVRPSDDSP